MPTIDERIVEMQFDNKDFEKNVGQSIKSLDALKQSLNFEESYDSLDKFAKSVNKVDLSGIKNSIDNIGKHFTAVGRFIDRHIDSVVKSVEGKIKSITFGQAQEGFNKYEDRMKAVQTITNATGKSVKEVEKVLDRLMYYTDETSYDFVQMANSIGKFTSAGVDLVVAEKAMEGIANEGALAGANKNEVNRAMYNFAQALSSGKVQLIDWKSIELANMSTKEFKEELIKTAIALGKIKKTSETTGVAITGTGKKAKETAVNYKTFENTLSSGWLTSDVLIKTLERYADTSTKVGEKGFKAAQKALTFNQAIEAIAESISSKWMKSFEHLFGNLDEAIVLWTDFCNAVIEVTGAIGDWRNKLLEGWHEQGGYNAMIEAATNIWSAFVSVLYMVRDAFSKIFPPMTSEKLVQITEHIRDVTESWKKMFGYVEEQEVEEKIETITDAAEDMTDALEKGLRGDKVKNLQEQLLKAGYRLDKYGADGIFGPETQAALKALQKEIGVKETGVWDETTRKAVIASKKFQVVAEETSSAYKKIGDSFITEEEYSQTVDYAKKITKTLKRGYTGSQVKVLQDQLVLLGYLDKAQADGIFGKGTENALKQLQKALGVEATGVWDKNTAAVVEAQKAFTVVETGIRKVSKTVGAQSTTMERLRHITLGLAAAARIIGSVFGLVGKSLKYVGKIISPIIDGILLFGAVIGDCFVNLESFINANNVIGKVFNKITNALEPVRKAFEKAGKSINDFLLKAPDISTFSKLFEHIRNELNKSSIWKYIVDSMKALNVFMKRIGIDIPLVVKKAKDSISTFWKSLSFSKKDISKKIFGLSFKKIGKEWNSFLRSMTISNNKLVKTIGIVMTKINNYINKIIPDLQSIYFSAKKWLGDSLEKIISWLVENIPFAIKSLSDFVSLVSSIVGPKLKEAFSWFSTNLSSRVKSVFDWFKKYGGGIKEVIKELSSAFLQFVGFSWKEPEGLKNVTTIADKLKVLKDNIVEFGKAIIEKIKSVYKDYPLLEKIWNFIEPIITKLTDFFKSLDASLFTGFLDTIKQSFTDFFNWSAKAEGEDTEISTLSPIERLQKRMTELRPIADSFNSLVSVVKTAWNGGKPVLADISQGVSEKGILGSLFENINKVIEKAKSFDYSVIAKTLFGAVGIYGIAKIANGIGNIGKGFKLGGEAFGGLSGALSGFLGTESIGDIVKKATDTMSAAIKSRPKDTIGTTVIKISQSIAMIAASVAGALAILSFIDLDKAKEGLVLFAELLAAITGAMTGLTKFAPNADKVGGGLLSMAASVGVLAAGISYMVDVIKNSSKANLDNALSVIKSMLWTLGEIEIAIAFVTRKKSGGFSIEVKGVLAMCEGVYILVLALNKMVNVVKNNKYAHVERALDIVKGFILRLGIIEVALAKISGFSKGFKIGGILSMCAGIYVLVLAIEKVVKGLNKNSNTYESAFNIIEALLSKIGGIEVKISALSKGGGVKIGGALATCIGIYVLTMALDKVVVGIEKHGENYESAFNLISSALWTLSLTTKILQSAITGLGLLPLVGAIKAVANLAIFIGGFSLVSAAFMGIDSLTNGWLSKALIDFSYSFGTAIGTFIKQIRNPDGETPEKGKDAIESLKDLSAKFNDFIDVLMPFLDKVKEIKLDHVAGVGNLVKVILEMTGASFLDSISSFASNKITGNETSGSGFVDMLKVLVDAIDPFSKFSEGLSSINVANITDYGVPAFEALQSLSASMIKIEWDQVKSTLFSIITGEQSIQAFVSSLVSIAPDLILFSTLASFINPKPVENVSTVLEKLGDAATSIPKANGLTQAIFGENDLSLFGSQLKTLGSGLYDYYKEVKDIPTTYKPDGTLKVLTSLVNLSEQIPKAGGLLQQLFGESSLDTFGSQLTTLGSGLTGFYNTTKEIPQDYTANGPLAVLNSLSDLQSGLEAQGGKLHEWIFGEKSLEEFGNQVSALGADLFSFNASTILVNTEKIKDIASALADLATAAYSGGNGSFMAQGMQAFQVAMYQLSTSIDWTPLIDIGEAMITNIVSGFDKADPTLPGAMDSLLKTAGQKVTDSNDTFSRKAQALMTAMSKAISNDYKVRNAFNSMLNAVVRVGSDKYDVFRALGIYLDAGIAKGIYEGENRAIEAAKDVVLAAYWAACNVVEVASPSKKFAEIGMYLDLGLVEGLRQYATNVKASAADSAAGAIEGAKGTLATFSSLIMDEIDDTPVIRPVLDLSNVAMGAAGLTGMFGTQTIGLQSAMLANRIAYARNEVPSVIYEGKNDNSNLNSTIEALNSRIDQLSQTISNMKVVTETGALIGEILPGIDKGLGKRAAAARRGG